jgi:DNA-binding MarR family transcriptional regulator
LQEFCGERERAETTLRAFPLAVFTEGSVLDDHQEQMYTHIMPEALKESHPPVLPCTCANLRRAARAVSRLYNRELQSHGIEITQFTLMMALHHVDEISQGDLGEMLALDSTSLTRMLKLLKDHGWVQAKEGRDRRFRLFRLSKAGREKFQECLPHWKQAQEQLEAAMGQKKMRELSAALAEVARVTV